MSGTDTPSRELGTSGVTVSPLGIGTSHWGRGAASRPELGPVFVAARAAGIDFFDTAEIYGPGGSERTLEQFLRAPVGSGSVVLSKFFPFPWRLRRGALRRALRSSLDRLGMKRLDVYLLHFPFPPVPIEAWAAAIGDAIEEGLVRAAGVSNCNAAQMRRAQAALARRGIPLACNEVEYGLLHRAPERSGLLAACARHGVTLIAYRPLGMGSLLRRGGELQGLIGRIGAANGKSAAQVALNWVICKGAIPIPGATSVTHVKDDAGALGWKLDQAEIAALDAASPGTIG